VQLVSQKTSHLFIYGILAALLLPALAYSAYWFVSAGRISTELERLDGNEIVPGVTLQFADMNVGGFPFRFDVFLGGVTLAAQGPDGERAWRSERVVLHTMGYGRAHHVLDAVGLQSFSWPGEDGAPQNILQMTSGITRASALIEEGRLERFDIDILNVEGQDVSLNAAPMREFNAARVQLHLMTQEDDTISFVAALDAGQIGTGYRPALGTDLSRVRIEGQISQAQRLQNLRAGVAGIRASLNAWRMAGGMILLHPMEAAWGGTLLQGSGELFLDEDRRLSGLLSASPEDPVSFLGALAQSEMIPLQTRAQLTGFREMVAGLPGNLDLPIRLEAHLPLGPEPAAPRLRIEGMNAIIVEFGGAAAP
jgi:hypothetical protein